MSKVKPLEIIGIDFPFHQPARRKHPYFLIIGIPQQVFQAIGTGKHIIVHTPYPIGIQFASLSDTCIKATRTAYIRLIHYRERILRSQPFGSTVGAPVIDHHNRRKRFILLQARNVAL